MFKFQDYAYFIFFQFCYETSHCHVAICQSAPFQADFPPLSNTAVINCKSCMEMGYLDCEFSQTGKTGESLVSLQEEYDLVRTKIFLCFFIHFPLCFCFLLFLYAFSSVSLQSACVWYFPYSGSSYQPQALYQIGLRFLFSNFLLQSLCKAQFFLLFSNFSYVQFSSCHSCFLLSALISPPLRLSCFWLCFSSLGFLLPSGSPNFAPCRT